MTVFRLEDLPPDDLQAFLGHFRKFIAINTVINDEMNVSVFESQLALAGPPQRSVDETAEHWSGLAEAYHRQAERYQDADDQFAGMAEIIRRNSPQGGE